MKKTTWRTIQKAFRILTGITVGCYIGYVLWVVINYALYPDVYVPCSAPWYTPIIAASVFFGLLLLFEGSALLFVRHKAAAGAVIGVIGRKEP